MTGSLNIPKLYGAPSRHFPCFEHSQYHLQQNSISSLAFQHRVYGADGECAVPAWLVKSRVQRAPSSAGDADGTEQVSCEGSSLGMLSYLKLFQ